MATQANIELAQKLYVAYYGRPADASGLNFWADKIEAEGAGSAVNAFGNSAEFDARFGDLTNEQLVNNLYNQMFGRNAELQGLNFYVDRLDSGEMSLAQIALAIANGAQNEDLTALNNKVDVAQSFTASIDTTEEVLAYQGNDAADAARDFLATVDENTDTAAVDVDAQLQALVDGDAQNPGSTFTLTASANDELVGTAGSDTFSGEAGTSYQAGDIIIDTSSADNDTLNVTASGSVAATPTVSGIENINFNVTSFTTPTVNVANIRGGTVTVNQQQTAGATSATVNNVAADLAVVAGSGVTGTFTVDLDATAGVDVSGVSVDGGSASTVAVTDIDSDGVSITAEEDAVVNLDGTAATDDAATVTASGAVALDTDGAVGDQVENLTLSGNGAEVTYTLSAGNAPEEVTIAGEQDVTLVAGAADLAGETVTDTSSANSTVRLNAVTAATHDLSDVAVDLIDVNAAAAAAGATLTVANEQSVLLSTDTTQTAALTLDSTELSSGAETLNLNVTSNQSVSNLDVSDFETVNLDTTNSATENASPVAIANLVASTASGSVVNVSGDENLTLTDAQATKLNASGLTGVLTAAIAADLNNIVGGSGDDVFTATDVDFTVDGGEGSDTLSFANSTDLSDNTVSLAGIETIQIDSDGTGNDNVTFDSSLITGQSFIVKGAGGTDNLVVSMDANSVDLSNLVVDSSTAAVTVTDAGVASIAHSIVGSNAADTLNAAASTGAITFDGGAGDDVVTTGSGADSLTGGMGNDQLSAGAGNDTLDGGAGDDALTGGAGNDTITAGEGTDHITGGAGADSIDVSESTAAADNIVYAALTDGSAAGTAGGTFTGFDTITGFDTGSDQIVFDSNYQNDGAVDTVVGVTLGANAVVVAGTDGSADNLDVTAADAADVDSMLAFFQDVLGSASTTGDAVVAVNFDGSSAFYNINDGGDAIAANEIQLLGTVDSEVAQGDFITA